ncbi:MAG: hypothetical protein WCO83_02300 [Alphaproteobacteria bacterium]
MTDQTPKEAGWYFARYFDDDEIQPVRILDKDSLFRVEIAGEIGSFRLDAFIWGPRITLPDELEGSQ